MDGRTGRGAGRGHLPGFAAVEVLYDEQGAVRGVATGDMGVARDGSHTDHYQPGMELHARYTVFAEGARGQLGRQLIERFKLDDGRNAQSYGIGIKEMWEVDPAQSKPGDPHRRLAAGRRHLRRLLPLSPGQQPGGGRPDRRPDYANPWLSPFDEFQRYKTHPAIRGTFEGGKRIAYGARAITAGGLLALPKLTVPGGVLVGCEAGFLNASRIKGSHAAIKTGMLAADAAFDAVQADRRQDELSAYPATFKSSWLHEELNKARNFKQWFKKGRTVATVMTGIEQLVLKGNFPWTLRNSKPDHASLQPASQCARIDYPKPDGKLTFDKLSSVFISNTNHDENEPVHLTLKDPAVPVQVNLAVRRPGIALLSGRRVRVRQGRPRRRPPADQRAELRALQDLRHQDPTQNIVWVAPCRAAKAPSTAACEHGRARAAHRLRRPGPAARAAAAGPGRGSPCPAAPAAR